MGVEPAKYFGGERLPNVGQREEIWREWEDDGVDVLLTWGRCDQMR
jgi:hypothetical protein